MEKNSFKQVLDDPRFKTMVRKKWLLSFGLSISMTFIYAFFVLVMIFKSEWLLPALSAGNPFNIGLLLTLMMLLFIIASMIGYLFFKENDTHVDIHQLIEEHEGRETEKPD